MRNLYLLAMLCFFSLSSCKKKEVLDDCLNTSPWYQKDVKLVFKSNLPGLADNVNYFVKEVNKSRVQVIDDIGIFVPIGHLRICDKKLYKASSLQYTDEQVFYDLNGSVGDKWIVETEEVSNRIVETITLKEKNVSLSVPNGTFETTIFLLEGFRNYPYSMKLYVTNDHGPVKLAGRSADLEFDLELSDRNF